MKSEIAIVGEEKSSFPAEEQMVAIGVVFVFRRRLTASRGPILENEVGREWTQGIDNYDMSTEDI